MNAWLGLATIAILAPISVALPPAGVGGARVLSSPTARTLRRHRARRWGARGRAGVAEALGRRSFRQVSDCTYWPRHRRWAQRCRDLPDADIREFRGLGSTL